MSILIKNVRAIDIGLDKVCDIYIQGDTIKQISHECKLSADTIIDASNLIAMPSLFDMHVHFRDPGLTYKEDIITGCRSALAGGFTGVACMPNTKPVVDNVETITYIKSKAKNTGVEVYPIATITKDMAGKKLSEFEVLKKAGAIAVSDDGKPVENADIMRKAIKKAFELNVPIISHCEDLNIIKGGIMHKGSISKELGVKGMDRASEDSITAREIALAQAVGGAIHIAHVSTVGSINFIRDAKKRGVKVTCETAPHYLMLTHEKLLSKDADFRMNPPLREPSDVDAMVQAVVDGTIDCIVTDHAPHTKEEKSNFEVAPNGVVGLETSFAGVVTALYLTGKVSLERIVELMSVNPRKILHIPVETLRVGAKANIMLADLNQRWIVNPDDLHSKSKNTVFKGMTLTGKPVMTISNGRVAFSTLD
ncbi:MAG: dihydroorotase [Ruminococcus sp.]|nr:dihydroorotase [Ruminococcus sp.]